MLVLGIESSCDETGVALVQSHGGPVPQLLSPALYSQIEMHQAYGGVVPELVSRDHIRRVLPLTTQVMQEAGKTLQDIDVVVGLDFVAQPVVVIVSSNINVNIKYLLHLNIGNQNLVFINKRQTVCY